MAIKYITTDLNLKSKFDLSELAKHLCKDESPHLNEWVNNTYELRLGGSAFNKSPSNDIELYCQKIEALNETNRERWDNCESRVLDVAFEGGETPNNLTNLIDEKLILKLSKLKVGLEITIYQTGLHAHLD